MGAPLGCTKDGRKVALIVEASMLDVGRDRVQYGAADGRPHWGLPGLVVEGRCEGLDSRQGDVARGDGWRQWPPRSRACRSITPPQPPDCLP